MKDQMIALTLGTSGDNYGRFGIGTTIDAALKKAGMKKRQPFRSFEASVDDPEFFAVDGNGTVTWKPGADVTITKWRGGKAVEWKVREAKKC